MRLAKTDIIAGLEAPVARDLMRRLRTPGDTDYLRFRLPGGVEAAAVAEQLFAEGFLEPAKGHPAGQAWWITTIKGNALAMASFGKPITRATAEQLLTGLIDRAATWNTNDGRLISVEQLVVFGSYLDPTIERLGDLDIAATLARCPPGADGQDWVKRSRAHGRASGRTFSTFVDELYWPEDEAKMMLRNRSTAINITTEDIRNLTTRFTVVYTRAASPQ